MRKPGTCCPGFFSRRTMKKKVFVRFGWCFVPSVDYIVQGSCDEVVFEIKKDCEIL